MNTSPRDALDPMIQNLRDTLAERLAEGLAQRQVATLTLGQLRDFVHQEIGVVFSEGSASPAGMPQLAAGATAGRVAAESPALQITATASADVNRAATESVQSQPGTFRLGPLLLIGIVLALGYTFAGSTIRVAPAANVNRQQPPVVPAPARVEGARFETYASDGSVFKPQHIYQGDESGKLYEIAIGSITAKNGSLALFVGGAQEMDGVVDYLRLRSANGMDFKFEAEDPIVTVGDAFSRDDNPTDGHWWLQEFPSFSGGKGLVIRKTERVPLLTMTARVPDGEYTAFVGTFTGDGASGTFGLGLALK